VPPTFEELSVQIMKKTLLTLLVVMIVCTVVSFSKEARSFQFEQDEKLARDSVQIYKAEKMGETKNHIMTIHLFINRDLKGNNIMKEEEPKDSLGFLYVEIVEEDYFRKQNRDYYTFKYDYSPIWGFLKEEPNKHVESFLDYRQNNEDFGGRSYCSDCGEPLAYGKRQSDILDDNLIWLKNQWLDFNKSYEFELEWYFEDELFKRHFTITE